MGARWAWDAECRACRHQWGGFSGGPDDCPECGSDDVQEYPHSDALPDSRVKVSPRVEVKVNLYALLSQAINDQLVFAGERLRDDGMDKHGWSLPRYGDPDHEAVTDRLAGLAMAGVCNVIDFDD